MIDVEVLRHAKRLMAEDQSGSDYVFRSALDDLFAQFQMLLVKSESNDDQLEHRDWVKSICRPLWHWTSRVSDLVGRLHFMEWFWNEFAAKDSPSDGSFSYFGSFLVKDFHMDVSSVMDSLAPIIILTTQELKRKDRRKFPGFADVLEDSQRSFRENLTDDLRDLVDDSLRWWIKVKAIRDTLAHRENHRIVFGRPSDGKLFQVYDAGFKKQIEDDPLMFNPNVVNFEAYATFIWAELFVLFDRLGTLIANYRSIEISGRSGRAVAIPYLSRELDKLIDSCDETAA